MNQSIKLTLEMVDKTRSKIRGYTSNVSKVSAQLDKMNKEQRKLTAAKPWGKQSADLKKLNAQINRANRHLKHYKRTLSRLSFQKLFQQATLGTKRFFKSLQSGWIRATAQATRFFNRIKSKAARAVRLTFKYSGLGVAASSFASSFVAALSGYSIFNGIMNTNAERFQTYNDAKTAGVSPGFLSASTQVIQRFAPTIDQEAVRDMYTVFAQRRGEIATNDKWGGFDELKLIDPVAAAKITDPNTSQEDAIAALFSLARQTENGTSERFLIDNLMAGRSEELISFIKADKDLLAKYEAEALARIQSLPYSPQEEQNLSEHNNEYLRLTESLKGLRVVVAGIATPELTSFFRDLANEINENRNGIADGFGSFAKFLVEGVKAFATADNLENIGELLVSFGQTVKDVINGIRDFLIDLNVVQATPKDRERRREKLSAPGQSGLDGQAATAINNRKSSNASGPARNETQQLGDAYMRLLAAVKGLDISEEVIQRRTDERIAAAGDGAYDAFMLRLQGLLQTGTGQFGVETPSQASRLYTDDQIIEILGSDVYDSLSTGGSEAATKIGNSIEASGVVAATALAGAGPSLGTQMQEGFNAYQQGLMFAQGFSDGGAQVRLAGQPPGMVNRSTQATKPTQQYRFGTVAE